MTEESGPRALLMLRADQVLDQEGGDLLWDDHLEDVDAFVSSRVPDGDWCGGEDGISVLLSGDWSDGEAVVVEQGQWMVSLEVGQLVAMSEAEYDAAGRPGDPAASPPAAPAAGPRLP